MGESERKVTMAQGEAKQKQWQDKARADGAQSKIGEVMFMETSAMTKINVDETFKGLVRLMFKDKPAPKPSASSTTSNASAASQPAEPKTSGDKGGGCKCVVQ